MVSDNEAVSNWRDLAPSVLENKNVFYELYYNMYHVLNWNKRLQTKLLFTEMSTWSRIKMDIQKNSLLCSDSSTKTRSGKYIVLFGDARTAAPPSQFLADKLTLFQPWRADSAHPLLLATPSGITAIKVI